MEQQQPDERSHLDYPEPLRASIDTLVEQLADRESLDSAMRWAMLRQKELYEENRWKRAMNKAITPHEEEELEEITSTLLSLQRLNEKYNPDQ